MNDVTAKRKSTTAGPAVRTRAKLGVLLALSVGLATGYSARSHGAAIEIGIAPPPPRVVEAPPPRPGFVWAQGYWAWNGHEHVWREGHWIPERRGYRWIADRWDERHGHWHYVPGHWER